MAFPLYIVDAFSSERFSGNPAAVCILNEERDSEWMQSVASEMNLSETAFLLRRNDRFHLKWFTPAAEVALCGHATLAAAHIIWQESLLRAGTPAVFETLSGRLSAIKSGVWISLDFPSLAVEQREPPAGLIEALGVEPIFVGKSRFDYLIEVQDEAAVRSAKPNFAELSTIHSVRGSIITSKSTALEHDFVSRFFAPSVGINEDPVTGSAHCCLGPYWSTKLGRNQLTGYQASQRGGVVRVAVDGSRVQLSGQAVTVLTGHLV